MSGDEYEKDKESRKKGLERRWQDKDKELGKRPHDFYKKRKQELSQEDDNLDIEDLEDN